MTKQQQKAYKSSSYLLDVLGLDGKGTSSGKKGGENSELHVDVL